ncbi:MAG: SBBP repeat-containing protein [Sphingobacteriaceae bacterium]|nr:SBBP repeat-containing protein [Sphingobacteriaceae bacterium]
MFFSFLFLKVSSQPCPQLSTYFGKTQIEEFKGVCKDNKGNIYAIGNTTSSDLPVTAGAFQSIYKANYEAFIVKFDSCGALIWCTYFGTNGFDSGEKIAYSNLDSSIVITGYTDGTDLDTTYNCFQPTSIGMNDCFLAKFNLNGQAKWITYFGGTQSDFSYAISIDSKSNIIIGGTSLSPSIHTSTLSFQQNLVGAVDAFIARFNKNGQLKFSTFYGGSNAEDIHDVTTDVDGNIIGIGGSFSNNLNTSLGCLQASSNGGMEIYVIKLDSIGNRLFSTYIGGTGTDDSYGACTDQQKNIYLTGHTTSNDFYKTAISHQTLIAGNNDNYCLKLTPTGTLVWSTIYGGSSFDLNVHCKIDANNNIYSLINSQSNDFPMLGTGNYTVYNGSNEIVVTKINSNGQLIWSSYKGGSGGEVPGDLVLFNNRIVMCGSTSSADFPVNASNYQLTNSGQDDGFLASISSIINVNIGVKNYASQKCEPFLKNNNNFYELHIPCQQIKSVIVHDILGKQIQESSVRDGVAEFENLSRNQVYFVSGFDIAKNKTFVFKLFLIDFGQ